MEMENIKSSASQRWEDLKTMISTGQVAKISALILLLLVLVIALTGFIWDSEPGMMDIREITQNPTEHT